MQLVEQHVIKPTHPCYKEIDAAAFASKNLYNAATYEMRQCFFATGQCLSYHTLYVTFQSRDEYKALPRKVSQWVLKLVDKNWKAYRAAIKEYQKNPSAFLGEPHIPGYKDKQEGRNVLVYTEQAVSRRALRDGKVQPSGLPTITRTLQTEVDQVRIVPKKTHYVMEVVYNKEPEPRSQSEHVVGMDVGLGNLVVIASDKPGFMPVVVNGRPLKSINQYYNKQRARLQSLLPGNRKTSRQIDRMTDKRNRRINHYLHTASRRVVRMLTREDIGAVIMGKNDNWKQSARMGRRTNQNFISVPHARFLHMLEYKLELAGIARHFTEENHTSKCSFLDLEPVCHHAKYAGRRVKRGLFRSRNGTAMNADLNAAYNMIRKVVPEAFSQGIEGVVVHPMPLGMNGGYVHKCA